VRIAALNIKNFRGIREGEVRFKAHTVLIGPSNVGKTTIIEALALLLGRDRLIRELTEHDFTGSNPAAADRIRLVATVTDFPTQEHVDHLDWFRDGRGVPKYFDPAKGQIHPSRDDPTWTLAGQIGFQARFDRDAILVETVRYFHDHGDDFDAFDGDGMVVAVPPRVIDDLGFYLVRASRTWDGMISFGSELFRRTIASVKGQPASAILAERDRLRAPRDPIEQDPKLKPLVERIDAETARLLPRSPSLKLRVSTTDSRGVLDSVVAHFAEPGGPEIPATRQGSGLVSLQGLLLLLELARGRREAGTSFFMAVEEPELHVPAPSQGRLVRRIQALSPQSITTTHASSVAAAADPTAVLVLRNDGGVLRAEPLLTAPLTDDAQNYIRKLFISGRQALIAALTHEIVLVPEGRSEGLLAAIAHALDARQIWADDASPSFALEVGVIATDDAKVVETHRLIGRLHPRVCCLVDGDEDGERYAAGLRADGLPATRILSWPRGWGFEKLIGWILEADEEAIVAMLGELDGPPKSVVDVIQLLEAEKANLIVYETLAAAIADSKPSAARARDLLAAMASACAGKPTPRFQPDAGGIMVFVP
jgi:putative ATP-dependent endonuclease of the OLD family